jgi:hypothetical protein
MSWNYRVMTLDNGKSYGIHEVYYKEDGTLSMYSDSIDPYGESIEELENDLKLMLKAFKKDVLTPEDFKK